MIFKKYFEDIFEGYGQDVILIVPLASVFSKELNILRGHSTFFAPKLSILYDFFFYMKRKN